MTEVFVDPMGVEGEPFRFGMDDFASDVIYRASFDQNGIIFVAETHTNVGTSFASVESGVWQTSRRQYQFERVVITNV